MRKNVVTTNSTGIRATENSLIAGNVASNNSVGISFNEARVIGNAAVGNGTGLAAAGSSVVERNNVFGNSGCGMTNVATGLPATGNYWGAPTGPGPTPADEVCNTPTASATVAPFATKPYKVDPSIKP